MRRTLVGRGLGRSLGRRLLVVAASASCLAGTIVLGAGNAAAAPTTVDGQFSALGQLGQGDSVDLTVVGRGGVPATGVGAVALNVTATNPTAPSFLTVWPTGGDRPLASNLNFGGGQTIPNMVIVPVGAGGQVSFFNNTGGVDVVVDVLGWFPTGASYTGLSPARLMDTRGGNPTIDGQFAGAGQVGQAGSVDLTVVGRGGVPVAGVGAVALNVTATNPTAPSFLTVWPTGADRPLASNLNFGGGQTIPNMVIVPVGAGGQVSFFNNTGGVDVVVDVLGWFPTGASYTGLSPARLMDTRGGNPTIDGQFAGAGQVGQASSVNLTVVGRGGVPATGVGAVALNVTVTNPTNSSFLTVWPTGADRPLASNLNFVGGQTIPNMVIVPVGAGGQVSLYNNTGGVDVVVDVLGWFPTGASYTGLTPARQMDTRVPDAIPAFPIGPVRNLLVARPVMHQMSGSDRIAVYVCDVPVTTTDPRYAFEGPTRLSVEPRTVARWAQREVAPYFDISSGGHFETTFVALGHIPLADSQGPHDCLDKATAMTGRPFTNVLVTDNTEAGDGFGGPGLIFSSDAANPNRFDQPPAATRRGSWVGGGSTDPDGTPSAIVVAHEIGHSLHWPHSFTGPGYEYDNPIDLMSGQPADGWCEKPDPTFGFGGTVSWPCHPQNTLAFNRFAAGWIDDSQVQLQTGGTNTFTLDAPAGGGTEMVAAPDPSNAHVMLTLEARPKVGFDQFVAVEGVAVHMIDQRTGSCFSFLSSSCISTDRRQRPAIPRTATEDYLHVLQLGTTTVVDGVSISVVAHAGNTFTVQVSGTFVAPPPQV